MKLTIEVEVDAEEWGLAERNADIATAGNVTAKEALAKDVESVLEHQDVYGARVTGVFESFG